MVDKQGIKLMKPIPPDFQPDERSLGNLRKWITLDIYMFRNFIDWELPNFITYFTETKAKKKSWQMTFQRWMRTAWTGKAGRDWEYNRHKRHDYSTPLVDYFPATQTTLGTIPTFDKPITPEQSIANFNRQEAKFNLK